MRRLLIASLLLLSARAAAPRPHRAAPPRSSLDETQLEAVHAQRVEWMKQRAGGSPLGIYQDYRAVFTHSGASRKDLVKAAQESGVQVVLSKGAEPAFESGVLFLAPPERGLEEIYRRPEESANEKLLRRRIKQYPEEAFGAATSAQTELIAHWDGATASGSATGFAWSDAGGDASPLIAFRNTSTHILAQELTESGILTSLAQGHAYVAHDWLCDPTGFTFYAANFLGVFDMGDTVPTGLLAGRPSCRCPPGSS